MPKHKDYECIRCYYTTPYKANMRRHLTGNKTKCPAEKNDIEITPEICDKILTNRRITLTNAKKDINFIFNNVFSLMNPPEKLNKLMEFKNNKMLDFDNGLDDKYEDKVEKLQNGGFKYGFSLDKNQILNIVDENTGNFPDFESMNILFDHKTNKISIYRIPKWETHLLNAGIVEIIRTLKSYYLDMYEQYLIKELTLSMKYLGQNQNSLNEYYSFIACFDLKPFVWGKTDDEILSRDNYNDTNKYTLEEHYMSVYNNIIHATKKTDINAMWNRVIDIVKTNGKFNLEKLNTEIMKVINIDANFKSKFIEEYSSLPPLLG